MFLFILVTAPSMFVHYARVLLLLVCVHVVPSLVVLALIIKVLFSLTLCQIDLIMESTVDRELKRRPGRPLLTEDERKRSKKEANVRYRERQKLLTYNMKLPVSVYQLWRLKAMQLGRLSNAELATLLLNTHTQMQK